MQMREKVGKSRCTVFFQWFVPPEGRKVGSLKRRVRSKLVSWEMKNCTPLWHEAHFRISKSKCTKTNHVRTTFGSWDVEKAYAVVARSTFPSQNAQNTPRSDHFWKLRCRKSARRCGAKHMSKSKCTKHTMVGPLLEVEMWKKCSVRRCGTKHISKRKCTKHTTFGPLLDVEMSKKCTLLRREAHLEVYKTHHARTTFGSSDVEKSARRCGAKHIWKWKCANNQGFEPLLEVQMWLRFASLHYTTPHNTTTTTTQLHSTTLHYTTLHYTTQHFTTLHSNTLHCTLHYTSLHYTTLHPTTLQLQLHSNTLHYTPLH